MDQYRVIERFRPGCMDAVYDRFHSRGRLLPDGLNYLNSWLDTSSQVCFQLMETDNKALFEEWFKSWNDLVEFKLHDIEPK
jgi:hypothetical protein